MEISYVKQSWNNSQPRESTELLFAELRTIGGSGTATGGSGSATGGSGSATGGAVGVGTVGSAVERGGNFDLVIHNVASYPYPLQKATFDALWGPRLNHGGVYVMEGLEMSSRDGDLLVHSQGGASLMIRDIVSWAGSLLYNGRIAGRWCFDNQSRLSTTRYLEHTIFLVNTLTRQHPRSKHSLTHTQSTHLLTHRPTNPHQLTPHPLTPPDQQNIPLSSLHHNRIVFQTCTMAENPTMIRPKTSTGRCYLRSHHPLNC